MKKLTFIIMMVAFTFITNAQIKVASNNSVGIGTENPISKLSVGTDGDIYNKVYIRNDNTSGYQRGMTVVQADGSSGVYRAIVTSIAQGTGTAKIYGLYSSAYRSSPVSSGRSCGVYGIGGNATSGWNSGVFGELYGTNNGAAIFGATPGKGETYINNIYAGYFRGKVYIEDNVGIKNLNPQYSLDVGGDINANGYLRSYGNIITSDISAKENIQDLGKENLSKIKELKAVTYNYKQQELDKNESLLAMSSDTGVVNIQVDDLLSEEITNKEQIGFIAQDLQKVYPELVVADKDGMLGINYTGLIPILVEVIKEQQFQIDALEIKVEKLGVK